MYEVKAHMIIFGCLKYYFLGGKYEKNNPNQRKKKYLKARDWIKCFQRWQEINKWNFYFENPSQIKKSVNHLQTKFVKNQMFEEEDLRLDIPRIKILQAPNGNVLFQIISQNPDNILNNPTDVKRFTSQQNFSHGSVLSQFGTIEKLRKMMEDQSNYTFSHHTKILELKWSLKTYSFQIENFIYAITFEQQEMSEESQIKIANEMLLNQIKEQRKIIELQKKHIANLASKEEIQYLDRQYEREAKKDADEKIKQEQARQARRQQRQARGQPDYDSQEEEEKKAAAAKSKKIKKRRKNKKNLFKHVNEETLVRLRKQKQLLETEREKNKVNDPVVEQKLMLVKDIYYQIKRKAEVNPKVNKAKLFETLKINKKEDLARMKLSINLISMVGRFFVGETKDDIQNGIGIGGSGDDCYLGAWADGKAHGKGKYQDPSGNPYIGDYVVDEKHGYGIDIFKNGDRYEGFFVHDERSGFGIYSFKNGEYFQGEWKQNKAEGPGIQFYRDGRYFEGIWKNDQKNGEGFLYDQEGNKTRQIWVDGVLEEQEDILPSDDSVRGESG